MVSMSFTGMDTCCKQEKARAISATVRELSREQRRGATESIRIFRSVVDEGLLLE
jgi:hypothetical protein